MNLVNKLLRRDKAKYAAGRIVRWLWAALRGNRLQAGLNAAVGLASVGVDLGSVWAVQRAVDIASGARQGSLY